VVRAFVEFLRFMAGGTRDAFASADLRRRYFLGWWRALRAFSLVIALHSCLLGVVLAGRDGYGDIAMAVLVVIAGLLIQSGVNLVNDFFEFKQRNIDDKIPALRIFGSERDFLEWAIFISGLACFALVVPIGIYLAVRTGWPLLILGAIGFVGGYFYTGEPFNYKRRGLGVFFVFFLMGTFMISGSYYAVSGFFSLESVWIGIPIGALISHILLCNEIRDHEYDREHGIATLTSRIGIDRSIVLSWILLAVAYLGPVVLHVAGLLPHLWFVFLSLPFVVKPIRRLRAPRPKRIVLIPAIMLHHFVYGTMFVLTYLWSPDFPIEPVAAPAAEALPAVSAAPLAVGLMPAVDSVPLLVAAHFGFFAEEGVEVELVMFRNQLYREAALQTGEIDGSVSDLINSLNAVARGFPLRVTSATDGRFALLAAPGSAHRSIVSWREGSGRIETGLLESSVIFYVTERMLEAGGVDPGRIELVVSPEVPARLEMLLAGRLEAACLPEPLSRLAVAGGAAIVVESTTMEESAGVLVFTEEAIREKGESIRRFYRAYDRAVEVLEEGGSVDPELRAVIVRTGEFPPAVVETMELPRYRAARLPSRALVDDVESWMREKGQLEVAVAYETLVAVGFHE
jgi:1,4-dihydroxy-2-naphthoate octaprenyltransferase/ABC-type nitrate/sulfonate/bicarbonate transport system substrate-binding protein